MSQPEPSHRDSPASRSVGELPSLAGGGEDAGIVYLVGAGPGHPGLITVRGWECLQRAEVVLYDYLANSELLEAAPAGCRLVCLGRHGAGRLWTQDEIHAELIAEARRGRRVVRLKGGDPAVFARLAEEVEALEDAGVRYEVVPGVTAMLAAATHVGLPLTHRRISSAVALVTGHQGEGAGGDGSPELDYSALARFPGTQVYYMGVTTARRWTGQLIEAGKAPDTPAAIVRHCSLPQQWTLLTRLDEVADRLEEAAIRPPVLVVVGESVAAARRPSWFERLPLFGQSVLVTRPRHQAAGIRAQFRELGAEVLVQPAIEIQEADSWADWDRELDRIDSLDWLVFSSSNGVHFGLRRWLQRADIRRLGSVRIACIGPGTAAALAEYHLRADLQPAEYNAERLAETLLAETPVAGRRFLLARASRGREILAEALAAAGGQVSQAVVYASQDVERVDTQLQSRMAEGGISWTTVTSPAIARSLHRLFGDALRATRLVSISPLTTATLRDLGLAPAAEAREATMPGIVQAIVLAANDLSIS